MILTINLPLVNGSMVSATGRSPSKGTDRITTSDELAASSLLDPVILRSGVIEDISSAACSARS